jgi:hypothetical protein
MEVGKILNLTASGVSNAIKRGENYLNEHHEIKQRIQAKLVK